MNTARPTSLLALCGGALALMFLAGPAAALPPAGASPDTPGTSATSSPKQLRAGATISFAIKGFPAGEVVSVKIDDGDFCSAQGVHGACVVHQQKSGKDGSMAGSFVLPADLPAGKHWLRFLASEEMTDADGNYLGVKPYSLRGNSGFTVKAASSGSGEPRTSEATGAGSATSGGGNDAIQPNRTGTSGTPGLVAPRAPGGAPSLTEEGPGSETADARGAESAPLVVPALTTARSVDADSAQVTGAESAPSGSQPVPWVGAGVLAACLIGVGAVFATALVRNGRNARSA